MRLSLGKNHAPKTLKTSKRKTLTKKQKRGWTIFGGVIIAFMVIGYIDGVMEQSRLEKDNVPIVISEVEDGIKLDYHTNEREVSAKISGVSVFADVKVAGDSTSIHGRKDTAGMIKYKIKDIKEGDSKITISVVDGKRHGDKTIKLHRQTKTDYDKQELEKALKRTEKSVKEVEEKPTDENISRAKSDINKLPNDRRAQFSERIAKLEKAKQEEKERAKQAKKAAEEKKKQEEARAEQARKAIEEKKRQEEVAAARHQHNRVRQSPPQPQQPPQPAAPAKPHQATPTPIPAPADLHFHNCKEARAAGYSHIRRGEPGYSPHLDRDGDGIACDKYK